MPERFTEFLVALDGKSPKNLRDSIRRVSNASAGFRSSWLEGQVSEALETSQEAFEHLDYVQNELLRQRDSQKQNVPTWTGSTFNRSLSQIVGRILKDVSLADSGWFSTLGQGLGDLPPGCTPTDLTLQVALNKLKHRDMVAVNFALPADGGHTLYVLTGAGMGQGVSLSEISIPAFCAACRVAAAHV